MAEYTVGQTNINVTANTQAAVDAIRKVTTVTKAFTKSISTLEQTTNSFKKSMGIMSDGVDNVEKEMKGATKETKKLALETKKLGTESEKAGDKVSRKLLGAFNVAKLMYFSRVFGRFLKATIGEISGFGENYNLFNVAMRFNTEEAMKFQHSLSQMYNVNMSETMKFQGSFMNIGQALGIGTEQSYKMSEALTLLTYDLASLYNWTHDMSYNRLLAGIVGQTKPLRYAGIDVTQQTIQPILDELGIQKSVIQLTQAEKVMLRTIAVFRQSGNAQGDYTRTVESLANQLKIMQDQFKELTRWIGAIFYGAVIKIMPVVNAMIMVFKELARVVATFFGFDLSQFDFVGGSMSDGFVDAIDSIEGTEEALKKLRGGLRKFDEINNISISGGNNVALGSATAITLQKELNRLTEEYKAKLGTIKTRAMQIKEDVMKWLGFTEDTDDVTGEVLYKFTGISKISFDPIAKSLSSLWDSTKRFTRNAVDLIIMFYKEFVQPISKIVIENTIPKFLDALSYFVNIFSEIYENGGRESLIGIYRNFLLPISKLVLDVFNKSLDNLSLIFKDIGEWARKNPMLADFITKVIVALMLVKGMSGLSAILFGVANPLGMIAIAIGMIMIYKYDDIKKWFDGLSPTQQMIASLSLFAAGIMTVAVAVMALQSAWTLGLGAIAIVAGISAMSIAVKNMQKGLPTGSPTIAGTTMPTSTYQGSQIGGGTYQGGNMGGGTYQFPPEYASGGMPSMGEMFIAREAGPELVGSIGNRSAVLNNKQIVDSVSTGVASAVSAVMGKESSQVVNLYADDILLGKAVIRSINKTQLATGLTIK